jgi:hypothetical protein
MKNLIRLTAVFILVGCGYFIQDIHQLYKIHKLRSAPAGNGDIIFTVGESYEKLKVTQRGDVYIDGKIVGSDQKIFEMLKDFYLGKLCWTGGEGPMMKNKNAPIPEHLKRPSEKAKGANKG